MTLTQQLIQEIIAEISSIKEAAKNKNLDRYSLDALTQRQALLQSKLNNLLQKKGLALSESEADKIYEELRLKRKGSLEAAYKRGYTGFLIFGGLLIVGLYFAFKTKK